MEQFTVISRKEFDEEQNERRSFIKYMEQFDDAVDMLSSLHTTMYASYEQYLTTLLSKIEEEKERMTSVELPFEDFHTQMAKYAKLRKEILTMKHGETP